MVSTTVWRSILVVGMLLTGSFNTLSKKVQNQCVSPGLDGTPEHFHKPWFQTMVMFVGEALVLLLWLYQRDTTPPPPKNAQDNEERVSLIHNEKTDQQPQQEPAFSSRVPVPLLLAVPACLDLLGTTLAGIGLLYTSASVWQMLRGSIVLFTGGLSVLVLKRKLHAFNWIGIGITVCGLTLVGASSLLSESGRSNSDHTWLGVWLIVAGQLCNATQMIYEEVMIKKAGLPPAQIVGFEGVWGLVIMSLIVLPSLQFIPGGDDGSYENSLDALHQIAHNGLLMSMILVYMCSIAFYNFFGLAVAESLTSVHRTLIDGLRTTVVWSGGILIYYAGNTDYGEKWQPTSFIQLIGFILLLLGTLVYNRLILVPGLTYPDLEQPTRPRSDGAPQVRRRDQDHTLE